MTILIVDDEYDFLQAVKGVLEDEGYEVVATGDPEEALDLVERHRPALVLLDYMMPVLNGAEVFERFCAMDGMKEVPVVLMSAVQPKPLGKRSWNGYLHKPFRLSALLDVVTKYAGRPGAPS